MPIQSLGQLSADLFPDHPPMPADSGASRVHSGRSANRAAAWQRDLAQSYGYLLTQARTDDERAAAERLYEQALDQGPDFANYRTGSSFAEAPMNRIDRNAFARIIFALEMIERGTYRYSRKKGAQGMPRTTARVLKALLTLAMRYGRVFPSLDSLAALSCVCKQTVVNAIKLLELYGFVVVHRRIKRIRTALGLRTVQDSNAYTVQDPSGLGAIAIAVFKKASESRKSAASSPYGFKFSMRPDGTPPWDVPDGIFAATG